jgi:uncharacterized protein with HEPN domain
MDNRVKQYLFDIEQSISDVESYISAVKSLQEYEDDKLIRRAVERELEIIGEALNRILKIDSSIRIPNARKIVSLRNKIIHGYDEVDNVIIYTVATKHLDILKEDIDKL